MGLITEAEVTIELLRDGAEEWVCEEVRASKSGVMASFRTTRMTRARAESYRHGVLETEHTFTGVRRVTDWNKDEDGVNYDRLISARVERAMNEEMIQTSFFERMLKRP